MATIKVAGLEELLARKRAAAASDQDLSSRKRPAPEPSKASSSTKRSEASSQESHERALAAVLAVCREGKMDRLRSALTEHPSISLPSADEDGYSLLHGASSRVRERHAATQCTRKSTHESTHDPCCCRLRGVARGSAHLCLPVARQAWCSTTSLSCSLCGSRWASAVAHPRAPLSMRRTG